MAVKPLHRGRGWGGSSSSLRRALIAPMKNIDVASPRVAMAGATGDQNQAKKRHKTIKNRLFTHKNVTKQRELFLLSTELN